MKTKRSIFNSTALSGAAVMFACLIGINPSAQATAYLWTGNSGVDQQYSTGGNWVGGTAPGFDWAPVPTFDSNVVNGTVDMGLGYIAGSVVVASGATTDITFNGPGKLILGKIGGADDATVHLDAAGKNLTFNSPIGNAGWDGLLGFDVGAGRTLTINGGIIGNDWGGGPATVVKTGTGAAVITSGSFNIGGMTINEGTLQIGDGTDGHDGSLTSITTVNNNAALVYNLFGAKTAGYAISGIGTLTKNGAGMLTLTGVNTYTNTTTINAGTLEIGGAGTLGGGSYAGDISISGALVYSSSAAQTLSGIITGSGSITQSGSGTLTLTQALNAYPVHLFDGAITINSGTLQAPNQWWTLNTASSITVNGGTLNTGSVSHEVAHLFLNGGTVTSSGLDGPAWGNLLLYENSTVNAGGAAVSTLSVQQVNMHGNNVFAVSAGSTLNVTSTIADYEGAAGLTKTDTGTLTLTGASSYTGTTTVNGGLLQIDNASFLANTNQITVNPGGCIYFGGGTANGTNSAPISLNGDGAGNGALKTYVEASQITFSGPITLQSGSMINGFGGNTTLNFTHAIHGPGGLTFAATGGDNTHKDFMVLSGASDFTGNLLIVPWTARAQVTLSGGDNRLPTTAVVYVSGSTALPGALDLNGNNQTIAGLSDGGWGGTDTAARSVVNTNGTAVTLTLNTIADQSFSGTIGGADINGTTGNNLSLVKSGIATQTLTGVNTYIGSTAVSNGVLKVTQMLPTDTDVHIATGGKLELDFSGINTVRTLTIDNVLQERNKVYSNVNRAQALTGTGRLYVTNGAAPRGTLIRFY